MPSELVRSLAHIQLRNIENLSRVPYGAELKFAMEDNVPARHSRAVSGTLAVA